MIDFPAHDYKTNAEIESKESRRPRTMVPRAVEVLDARYRAQNQPVLQLYCRPEGRVLRKNVLTLELA